MFNQKKNTGRYRNILKDWLVITSTKFSNKKCIIRDVIEANKFIFLPRKVSSDKI